MKSKTTDMREQNTAATVYINGDNFNKVVKSNATIVLLPKPIIIYH